ncbi:hypothetical protein ACNFIA_17020 [Pseudomonas sp. NY15437]|uniref:hypothetical protein n=1 Tax=Pseudomonas sp. NY15437 TaxID=3400360 RepID=UPI003A847004
MSKLPGLNPGKGLSNDLRAFQVVKSVGCLKDGIHAVGCLLEAHFDQVLKQCRAGDWGAMTNLCTLASNATEVSLLRRYFILFLPVTFKDDGKFGRDNAPYDEERARRLLISPTVYKRLEATKLIITLDTLERIQQAIEPVAADWRAYLLDYLKWPRTDAPVGLGALFDAEWVTAGMLAHHGYHVGQSGAPLHTRLRILDQLLISDLNETPFSATYLREWGAPGGLVRLLKMANTIAALCRNAKRKPGNFGAAIDDWESDLKHLHDTHFVQYLKQSLGTWPTT